MAAATIIQQEISVLPGVQNDTWIEVVDIGSLGAGSPSTFTSNLGTINGAIGMLNSGAGATPGVRVSWAGRNVSLVFTSPTDDNASAFVLLIGKR